MNKNIYIATAKAALKIAITKCVEAEKFLEEAELAKDVTDAAWETACEVAEAIIQEAEGTEEKDKALEKARIKCCDVDVILDAAEIDRKNAWEATEAKGEEDSEELKAADAVWIETKKVWDDSVAKMEEARKVAENSDAKVELEIEKDKGVLEAVNKGRAAWDAQAAAQTKCDDADAVWEIANKNLEMIIGGVGEK